MTAFPGVVLQPLKREEIPFAAAVAGRAFQDNPLSVALFGDSPLKRVRSLETMFHMVLYWQMHPTLTARRHGTIVGLAAMAPAGQCYSHQMQARQRSVRLGNMNLGIGVPPIPLHLILPLLRLGPGALGRISEWGEVGLRHDPAEPHFHVELVAVEAALQGLGIGSLMMEKLCEEIDSAPLLAYLETDKPEDVRFYRRFGFDTAEEAAVLGVRTWFMRRPSTE